MKDENLELEKLEVEAPVRLPGGPGAWGQGPSPLARYPGISGRLRKMSKVSFHWLA